MKRENVFYRGRVIDYDEIEIEIKFLDYGYSAWTPSKDIYQWHPMWNLVPGTADSADSTKILTNLTYFFHFIQLKRIDAIWKM